MWQRHKWVWQCGISGNVVSGCDNDISDTDISGNDISGCGNDMSDFSVKTFSPLYRQAKNTR